MSTSGSDTTNAWNQGLFTQPQFGPQGKFGLMAQRPAALQEKGNPVPLPSLDQTKKIMWSKNMLENPLFVAFATGLIVFLIFIAINPPLVQKKIDNPLHRSSPDLVKVFLYSLGVSGAVFALPFIMSKKE